MDKYTLKSIIIDFKNKGCTFQDISNRLEVEYGIKMSRQAVHGMYTRATSDKQMDKNIDILIATADIYNYYVLGYSARQIKNILDNNKIKLSIKDIENKINEGSQSIEEIRENSLNTVIDCIKKNKDMEFIINSLVYKGIHPSKYVIEELMLNASTEILKSRAVDLMVKLINITDNKELAKKVAKTHNFNVSGKEISEALNR